MKHRRLETEGDPEPLPAPYDYQTQAQGGVFAGWAFGIITWVALGLQAPVFDVQPLDADEAPAQGEQSDDRVGEPGA